MLIYIVRHAIAEDRHKSDKDDAERALTPEGIAKMRRHVRALEQIDVRLTHVWTSPLVRARQTAELLAEGIKLREGVRVVRELAPGASFEMVLHHLRSLDPDAEVALVGHEPGLSALTTLLLTGSPGEAVEYRKGGVACIRLEDDGPPVCGRLMWLLPPRILRRIAH